MNNLSFVWYAAMSKPLWILVVAQLLVIIVGGLLGYYGTIHGEVAAVNALRQRNTLTQIEADAIDQHLARLPSLETLLSQRALLTENQPDIDVDTLTARLASPLQVSGATLLSLQRLVSTPGGSPPASPSVAATWVVKVSTNYQGALAFLQSLTALPQPVHLQSWGVSVQNEALHLELALSFPFQAGRDDNVVSR